MPAAWTIKDSEGQLLLGFRGRSRLEVARKVVGTRYDPFRLEVSASYREVFDRDVRKVLERNNWQIVRLGRGSRGAAETSAAHAFAAYPLELRAAA
jgi:hypothetical protein